MKEGWKNSVLGDIATYQSGCRPKGGVGTLKEGALSIGGEHIGKDGHIVLNNPKYVTRDFFDSNVKGHIENDDILLCKDGALTGKVAIVRTELLNQEAMINEHVFIIRSDKLSQKYLFYFLYSTIGQTMLKARISGAAQGGLNGTNLRSISVPYPTPKEQQHIVEELDLLSSIIEKKKAQLKELDNLAQSIFYEIFGDPITNEKGWEVKELKSICSKITDGTHDTPQRLDKGVKFITGKHIRPFSVDYDNSDYVTEEVHKVIFLRCNPEKGDVLYTNIGAGIGNAAINTVDYEFSMKNVALLKLRKKIVNGYYMEFYLNNDFIKTSIIENFSNGGAQKFLSLKSIARILVPVPPLDLQTQFVETVLAINNQKELIKQSIEEVETLFNSRMDYYFN